MLHQPVISSNLRSIAYDPANRILEVCFLSGAIYQYLEVPDLVHAELMAAKSKGKYLARFIKGRFDYRLVYTPPKRR